MRGNGVGQSIEILEGWRVAATCMFLHESRRENSALHIIKYNEYFQSPELQYQDRSSTCKNHPVAVKASNDSPFCIPSTVFNQYTQRDVKVVDENDTIIYAIGDDTPLHHPIVTTVKMDAKWHSDRINALKKQCYSMMILIAKNRYAELADGIIKECNPTNCNSESVKALSNAEVSQAKKSYFSLFLLSFGFISMVGILYKYVYCNQSKIIC